jgi:hypothetical protein
MARSPRPKQVGALHHSEKRLNIPTAEMQRFFQREKDHSPLPPKHYPRSRALAEGEHRNPSSCTWAASVSRRISAMSSDGMVQADFATVIYH